VKVEFDWQLMSEDRKNIGLASHQYFVLFFVQKKQKTAVIGGSERLNPLNIE
jgi:hypothetical protein